MVQLGRSSPPKTAFSGQAAPQKGAWGVHPQPHPIPIPMPCLPAMPCHALPCPSSPLPAKAHAILDSLSPTHPPSSDTTARGTHWDTVTVPSCMLGVATCIPVVRKYSPTSSEDSTPSYSRLLRYLTPGASSPVVRKKTCVWSPWLAGFDIS